VVRRTSKVKPVSSGKGADEHGQPCGQFSHGVTGRERGNWNTFFAQSGAIRADSLDDLIDTTIAFGHPSPAAAAG